MKLNWVVIGLLLCASNAGADTSELWGQRGERWKPDSRLPDFSFAGYRYNSEPVPYFSVKGNVKDFGAVGDGKKDDSEAFQKAIENVREGTLWVPAGRYRITRQLKIVRSQFVIRGEGPEKTVLVFPKPLSQVVGDAAQFAPGGSWSWSGGLISFEGKEEGTLLTGITAPVARGRRELRVAHAAGLKVGDRVRLVQSDEDGELGKLLYGGKAPSPKSFRNHPVVNFSSRIRGIKGQTVLLERPLRVDVRLSWKPALYADLPTVRDVGIEDLTIEFPDQMYVGHHQEPGFNAVEFSRVKNGWVRQVMILNADNGIFLRESTRFCTLQAVQLAFTKMRPRIGYGTHPGESQTVPVIGHHGILVTGVSQDNLITNFRIQGRFIHDLGVENAAAGNVFSAGKGTDLTLDHHRRAPYENLFTDIDVGEGTRIWENGGDEADGPPSGVRATFWGIRGAHIKELPVWALQSNFVGVPAAPGPAMLGDSWIEPIAPEKLAPANLQVGQQQSRKP